MSGSLTLKLASATLKVVSGGLAGLTFPLDQAQLIIGREADCHLQLADALCSRHHAVILCDAYTIRIRDLGSRNGTFVNQMRIRSATVLKNCDEIRVGGTTMIIRGNDSEGRDEATSPMPVLESETLHAEAQTVVAATKQPKILF